MRARGLSPRGEKKSVDRIAAAVILQGYLDAAARQRAQD
jgi:RNase H-fold protein (predicted Holliday junction resolvase)